MKVASFLCSFSDFHIVNRNANNDYCYQTCSLRSSDEHMSCRNLLANFLVAEPMVRGRVVDLCPRFSSENLRQHCKRRTSLMGGESEEKWELGKKLYLSRSIS